MEGCYFKDSKAPVQIEKGGVEININKADDYNIYYYNCRRLLEGYSNADGSKIDKIYAIYTSSWLPTQSASDYKINNVDKTADVPAIVQKYAGAGKIEIYKAYVDEIPAEETAEYAKAVKDSPTANTYDENGNKVTEVTTGIAQTVANGHAVTEYYTLNGMRVAKPVKGVNIRKTTDSAGRVQVSKIVVRE